MKRNTDIIRRFSIALVLAWLVSSGAQAGPEKKSTADLRVISFNIRCIAVDDGPDTWWFRKGRVADMIRKYDPDLMGLQEVYTIQAHDLARRLPQYKWFGAPRDDGKRRGERCTIFYKPERLDLLEQGIFWLSEKPDVPGSISWDSACHRVVTWGKFQDRRTGQVFFHFNTHFDHKGQVAREKSAELLVQRIKAIAGDTGAVVTGDFNTTDDTVPYQTITRLLTDSRAISREKPSGPGATTRDFKAGSMPKERIDFIFVAPGIAVDNYAVLDDTYGRDRRFSDHMPVLADVQLTKS